MTDLVVFGANGPTGRHVVRQALASHHRVVAVTRKPDAFPVSSPHLDIVCADVTDPVGVDRAVRDAQAVISTFGVPYSRRRITVYSQGITNIVQSMTARAITRLVCVSSTTVATESAPGDSLLWRTVVEPLLRNHIGRTLYDDMQRMEEIVQSSGLDWTIVRPGGLFNAAEPTNDYEVGPPRLCGRVTSRADLAATLIAEAVEPQYSRSIIEVVTRSVRPSPLNFLKETFGGSS